MATCCFCFAFCHVMTDSLSLPVLNVSIVFTVATSTAKNEVSSLFQQQLTAHSNHQNATTQPTSIEIVGFNGNSYFGQLCPSLRGVSHFAVYVPKSPLDPILNTL